MRRALLHISVLIVLGAAVYSNTLGSPFQWDEFSVVAKNPIVKDLGYFAEPSRAKGLGMLYLSFRDRYVGYLSFALNYKLHGLDVAGYHVVNIALHILNSILLYLLVFFTFKTPFLNESPLKEKSALIAFFASLLFLCHPVQTEAVTYVMGRLPVLMSFFYLSSIVLYVKWRLDGEIDSPLSIWSRNDNHPPPPLSKEGIKGEVIARSQATKQSKLFLFYLLSLLCALLAVKTKENALTLPLIIALYEFSFFGDKKSKSLLRVAPFALIFLVMAFTLLQGGWITGGAMAGLEAATRHYSDIPRLSYLLTQINVLSRYIGLIFYPSGQNVDRGFFLFDSFFSAGVFFPFLLLLAILSASFYIFRFSGKNHPELRLIAGGVFWFFITISIESSVFPIPLIMCEYRLYLPSAGIFAAVSAAGVVLAAKCESPLKKAFIGVIFLIAIISLSVSAYKRNSIWKSRTSLWEDSVKKSPDNPRGRLNLGIAYLDAGSPDKAIAQLASSLTLLSGAVEGAVRGEVHYNLGRAYDLKGLNDEAILQYLSALRLGFSEARILYNLGISYSKRGDTDEALKYLRETVRVEPDAAEAYQIMGNLYRGKGDMDEAIRYYLTALSLTPGVAEIHNNLGAALLETGRLNEALLHLTEAVRINPGYEKAYYNMGSLYAEKGQMDMAADYYGRAVGLNPGFKEAHYGLYLLYRKMGLPDKAAFHLRAAEIKGDTR